MDITSTQFSIYKDCFARRILAHSARRLDHDSGSSSESSELEDFSAYLAQESWSCLPPSLQTLSYENRSTATAVLDEQLDIFLDNTPISVIETLLSYGFSSDREDALKFLQKVINDFVEDATAPPPVWSATRTKECEICEREVPLTYHHLIPRSVHDKALKKGWHPKEMLGSVAWLCRCVPYIGKAYYMYRFESMIDHAIPWYIMWPRMKSLHGNTLQSIVCLREMMSCGGRIMLQNNVLASGEGKFPRERYPTRSCGYGMKI